MMIRKTFSFLILVFLVYSCSFRKSNTVYDSYLEDQTLVLYLTFNGNEADKSGSALKSMQDYTLYERDRFNNENSAIKLKDKAYLSYGDVLDNVFSGEKKRFSFSFWIKPSKNNSNAFIISKNADSNCDENERQFSVKLTDENKISFLWMYNNDRFNGWRMFESSKGLDKEQWQNVIITYDGHSNGGDGIFRTKLYINGKEEELIYASKRGRLGFITDKKAHLSIGNMVNSSGNPCTNSYLEGSLDDLMIFSRVITESEIKNISSQ